MSGRSPRPDLGRADYRFKINDDLRMLHETTLGLAHFILAGSSGLCYVYCVYLCLMKIGHYDEITVTIKCFDNFEVYSRGEKLTFKRRKFVACSGKEANYDKK